jgi:hypothetical protein
MARSERTRLTREPDMGGETWLTIRPANPTKDDRWITEQNKMNAGQS